jgi:hypothetical protein
MVWLIVVVNSILPYHRSLVTHPQPLNSHTDILTEFRNTFRQGIETSTQAPAGWAPSRSQGEVNPRQESVAEFREGGGSRFRAVFFVGG